MFAGPPLIVTGWDSPTPAQFRQHVAEFEKLGLFEGTNIDPTRRVKGGAVGSAKNAFSREPWQWEEFAEALADSRAAKTITTTCRETFLMISPVLPGGSTIGRSKISLMTCEAA